MPDANARFEIAEIWNSRSGSSGNGEADVLVLLDVYGYPADGDPNWIAQESDAWAAVYSWIDANFIHTDPLPKPYPGLFLTKERRKRIGGNRFLWEFDLTNRPGSPEYIGLEFEVATAQQRRKVSIATVNTFGGTRDFKGAINVSKDNVEGVDVHVGEAKFVLKKWFKPRSLTIDFFLTALALAGTTNNATFYGFPAGSLLFLGLGASWTYDVTTPADYQEPVEVPARFAFSRNVSDETIQGITGISRNGWEYPWPYFEDDTDDTNKLLVQKPVQINVEKVYPATNFNLLGYGTGFTP